jgi:hypothetical protein
MGIFWHVPKYRQGSQQIHHSQGMLPLLNYNLNGTNQLLVVFESLFSGCRVKFVTRNQMQMSASMKSR